MGVDICRKGTLGVSKAVGDLAGPMAFAFMMGLSRIIFSRSSGKFDMESKFLKFSCMLCMASYLCIVFIPSPVVGCSAAPYAACGRDALARRTAWCPQWRCPAAERLCFAARSGGRCGCTSGPTLAGLRSAPAAETCVWASKPALAFRF